MQSPPVGFPVQFFPGGEKSSHRQPFAAIVTETGQDGRVKLNLLAPGGGDMKGSNEFHRHISDPWVPLNRQYLAGGTGTMPRGCWDWVPGLMPAMTPNVIANPDPDREDRKDIGRAKVLELAQQNLEPADIARKVRSYGITRAEVDELIGVTA